MSPARLLGQILDEHLGGGDKGFLDATEVSVLAEALRDLERLLSDGGPVAGYVGPDGCDAPPVTLCDVAEALPPHAELVIRWREGMMVGCGAGPDGD